MKFCLVFQFYLVFIDESERRDYDYYLDHPENFAYNQFRFYRYRYAPKTDLRIVISVFVVLTTSLQWWLQHKRYNQARDYLKQHKEVRLRADKLFYKTEPELYSKICYKKSKSEKLQFEQKIEECIEKVLDTTTVEGGYGKPDWHFLYPILICKIPYNLYLYIKWLIHWYIDYNIKKLPYNEEDEIYLTRIAMNVSESQWNCIEADKQEEYISKYI